MNGHFLTAAHACYAILVAGWFVPSSLAYGHGSPIFVEVNPITNQVEVSSSFENAELDGTFTSDRPSLQVLSPFSGVPTSATVSLRATQGLLFSNSDELEATSATLDVFSAHFAEFSTITANSNLLPALPWTTYPGGNSWDADGLFSLGPGIPPTGVYGLGLQVLVDGAIPSETFLVPVVNNPIDMATSLAAVRDGLLPLPEADFDANWNVDEADLSIWQTNYSTMVPGRVLGDANGDMLVSGTDYLAWQRGHSMNIPVGTLINSIPEPTTGSLMLTILVVSSIRKYSF